MRLSLAAAALLASTAGAAKPTFQDVLKKFPAAAIPFTLKEAVPQQTPLGADDAAALGFLDDASPQLAPLRAWKKKPEKGETKALWPIAAIQRSTNRLLFVRLDVAAKPRTSKETFLLSYGEQGELLGGLSFHLEATSDAVSETNVSTVDAVGVVSRRTRLRRPLKLEGLPDELVVTTEQHAKVTSSGRLEVMEPLWTTKMGSYVDRATKEELWVFEHRVFHRAAGAAFQELEPDGATLHFRGDLTPYVLTWDERRSAVSWQKPGGAVQVFTRER